MSVQAAKDFVAKIEGDKSLAGSLESAADDDARRKIAADAGFDFTKAEMREALSGSKQLSDEDLDTVAGGSSATWVEVGAGVGGAAAAAA